MLTPDNLRCEYAVNPLGIDTPQPRLSWTLTAPARDQRQSAYQIIAASSRERCTPSTADLWDSGKVTSAAMLTPYAGAPLGSEAGCWWRVRVWDGDDQPSDFSPPAYFEMGLLSPQDWRANWIGFPGAWPGKAVYFRRDFVLDKPVRRARIYMVGLGWSELRVNGQRVNERVLDPPITNYTKRLLYSTDAVETFLRPGNNSIGVICGSGWYGTVRLLLQMKLYFEDGDTQEIITHCNWSQPWIVCSGPIQENSVYDGETFDARLDNPDWDNPDAPRPPGLVAANADGPNGRLVAAALEPIRIVETVTPVRVDQPAPGIYVFDMGRNMAGWARLRLRGERGQRVSLRFAESLYPDGTVNQENLRFARAEDVYILRGEGEEIWEPRFTYHGFRYVQVEGYPGAVDADSLHGRAVRTAAATSGEFECSHALFNRIHQMVRATEAANLHSIPTDCPQRDERMGWLNDMAARSEEAIYNFDLVRLLSKWIGDIADEQDPHSGAITDTAPFRWGRRPADPVSVCYLLIPWLLYVHYGDTHTLSEHYQGMKAWVDFLTTRAEDGIVRYSYYGDWAPPVHLGVSGSLGSSAVSRDTPGELVSTACYAYSAALLSHMAALVDQNDDAACYAALSQHAKERFHQCFWDETAGGYGSNNQSCNAIALYMEMVPAACQDRVVANLVHNVMTLNNGHLTTGNICTKYLLEALTAHGRADVAYTIAAQESYPSWGHMLANGATTLWERWEHATGSGMNSHNHPMLGSVGAWFYRNVAGIQADPGGPGFACFHVRPAIDGPVTAARATVQSVRGPIHVDWRNDGASLHLNLEVPTGSVAFVHLPAAVDAVVYEAGVPIWQAEKPAQPVAGLRAIQRQGGIVLCTVGGGRYALERRIGELSR